MTSMRRLLSLRNYYRSARDIPRLVLGSIFLFSAFIKNFDPFFFLQVIQQFHNLPVQKLVWIGYPAVYGIIFLEYAVGLAAITNLFPKLAVAGAFMLNGMFVFVLASHWGEVLNLGCGCFGYPKETVIDISVFWKNLFLFTLTATTAFFVFSEVKRK